MLRWEELERGASGEAPVEPAPSTVDYDDDLRPAPKGELERRAERVERSRKAVISRRDILLMLLDAEDELAELREENARLLAHHSMSHVEPTWKVSELAKMWGMKATELNKVLIVAGIQRKGEDGVYRVTEPYVGCGYTALKQARRKDGGTESYTVWTDRGRKWMESQLRYSGLLPEGALPEKREPEVPIIVMPREGGDV